MTTIVTDGKVICSDTQSRINFIDILPTRKIFKINGGVFGVCGELSSAMKYLEWIKKGRDEETKPTLDDDWHAIFVENGKVWHENNNLFPTRGGVPFAIGSGAPFAMGAMLAGATPQEAIKIAMKLDVDTGGKVRTMKC